MAIQKLVANPKKAVAADIQLTLNITDSGVPFLAKDPVVAPPVVIETPAAIAPVAPVVETQEEQLMDAIVQENPDIDSLDEAISINIVNFLTQYLSLTGKPSGAQVESLATALGWDAQDVSTILFQLSKGEVDDEITNKSRDADLQGLPGLNIPGDLDSFDNNDLQPHGVTSLDDIEVPGVERLFSSLSKEPDFMLPMSYMDDDQPRRSRETADVAPENHRTGIDDGSPVLKESDEAEQQALINDGEVDTVSLVDSINNNRYLNDDGL